jgi:hypothetical protein
MTDKTKSTWLAAFWAVVLGTLLTVLMLKVSGDLG